MAGHFILHAPNVHQGGGGTLLASLLTAVRESLARDESRTADLILDERFSPNCPSHSRLNVHRIRPTFSSRFGAERLLSRLSRAGSRVLCFAAMPPLFPCRGHVAVFVQNRNIVGRTDLAGYPVKQRLRISLERLWFRARAKLASEFVVQTETMAALVRNYVGEIRTVRVQPFLPSQAAMETSPAIVPFRPAKEFDFCYVATGEAHKNHRRLLEAWRLLAVSGQKPSLCLTLSRQHFPGLCADIETLVRASGVRIHNAGYVSREEVSEIYSRSRHLVFPSQYESFGLPLLEARDAGLPIVAAERDYVRDIVAPVESFDPDSPRSIARAVERVLGQSSPQLKITDPPGFLASLFAA